MSAVDRCQPATLAGFPKLEDRVLGFPKIRGTFWGGPYRGLGFRVGFPLFWETTSSLPAIPGRQGLEETVVEFTLVQEGRDGPMV